EMGDGYWNRQPPVHPSAGMLKRPRAEYDLPPTGLPSGHEMHNYMGGDDDRSGPRGVKDTQTIGSAYDRYLQNSQHPSFPTTDSYSRAGLGRAGMPPYSLADPVSMAHPGGVGSDLASNGRDMEFGRRLPVDDMVRPGRETVPLPPDASKTLYIEGLPPNSTRREVSHIFRPFVGYKEVRLVSKESKHRGGDPLILCFVDFINPACAATALSALQGYKMDEHDPDSAYLRLQFSKYPGPRSGSGSRGRR
ncbi:hypothetical protein RJ639_038321, partial [Escallonia herrerae]